MRNAAILACATLALSAGACAHRGGPPSGMMQGGFAMPVSAAPLMRGDIAETFSVTCTVVPKQLASLSSVVSGNVLMVAPQIGERVHQGELLVKIDDSTLRAEAAQAAAHLAQLRAAYKGGTTSAQANLASAKVAYDTATTNLWRNQQLFKQGYVSKAALDQATDQEKAAQAAYQAAVVANQNASLSGDDSAALADLKNAEAALQAVNTQIAQTNVRAPFDGVVTARNVDPGTLASPGTVLMEVAQLDPVFIDAGIAGSDLQYVHVGTPVTVTVNDINGRVWHGRVGYLNLAAVPGSLTYQARIPLANPDLVLRGGMVASATFERARKSGSLLAPRAAVFQTDAGYSMFVIDGGKAKSMLVEVGLANDQEMEVSAPGLKPGVLAILNHAATLQPGMPVQVVPAQPSASKPAPPPRSRKRA